MQNARQNRNTLLFVGFLLLAGLAYLLTRTGNILVDTTMFSVNYMIYSGLLLFWIQSVHARLLPSRARSRMLAAAVLMILFLFLRVFKYRICCFSTLLTRYSVYAYCVPMVLIPTLFLQVCLRIRRGDRRPVRWDERLILIFGILIAVLCLSNDLHKLLYIPEVPLAEFTVENGTYAHGPLFWAVYGWMILATLGGIILLFWTTGMYRIRKIASPLTVILVWIAMAGLNLLLNRRGGIRPYQMQEIHIFGMLGIFESCIRERLIPYNENYVQFFGMLRLPILITDRAWQPAYETERPVAADPGLLKASLGAAVYPDENTRLSGMKIRAGYAFFEEDESKLRRMNEELRDANEMLAMENEVNSRERELIEEKAGIEERSRLYAGVSREIYPVQKRIARLLDEAQPGTNGFRETIAKILVLEAYVKRKANFCMLEADRESITAEELVSAMKESAFYLRYAGINASVDRKRKGSYPCRTAMAVYDCFETVIESVYGKTDTLWVQLRDSQLLMMADTEDAPELPVMPLPVMTNHEDGQLTVRILTGGDAS